jgi:hypothetical protein
MDLNGGAQVYRTFTLMFAEHPPSEPIPTQVNRICAFHVILALAKWVELYDRYRAVIPVDTKDLAKGLRSSIVGKGIPSFRNKVVGHVWDKDKAAPLTPDEVDRRFEGVVGVHLADFMEWACATTSPSPINTAAGVIEHVRDRLGEEHSFTSRDLRG